MSNLTYSTGHNTGYGNATLLANPELCTLQTCDLSMANFNYLPSVAGNAIFAVIFGLLIIGQVFLGVRYRTFGYMVAMLCGLILEIVGYIGRVLLHNSPFDNNLFLIYLICLTIAPAFLTAAIYLCLSRIVIVYGAELSRFKPRTYTLVFCGCDLISLVLQGLGGGIASSANTTSSSNLGKNIMIAGLGFQVASLVLFVILCGEFAWRLRKFRESWSPKHLDLVHSRLFKLFLSALCIGVLTIFVRSLYRCIELSGGFNGSLFRGEQPVFMILEGAMISIATIALTVFHPGVCFQGAWNQANFTFRSPKTSGSKSQSSVSDEEAAFELTGRQSGRFSS
ncbi:hypothetical protein B7494_g2515 [Chlorociboria aeruginascens]|nr:hypothetical protein B7494_g2515 [Chlorociboria aeruginascens]